MVIKELTNKEMSLIYYAILIIVIITCLFVMLFIWSNGFNCVQDPIGFYGEKTNSICYCIPTWF